MHQVLPRRARFVSGRDLATALAHTGEAAEAVTLLEQIEAEKPGLYVTAANLGTAYGGWAECLDSVNSLIGDLVQPSTEVARVIGAVAKGDLSQTMALEVDGRSLKGEFLHTARVVNTMVAQLNSFASEVTRVAREVGTEGKLGGRRW